LPIINGTPCRNTAEIKKLLTALVETTAAGELDAQLAAAQPAAAKPKKPAPVKAT